jgi:hypothetical protein
MDLAPHSRDSLSAGGAPRYTVAMESVEVCVANIGPRQRRLRAMIGLVGLAIGLAATGVLVWLHVAWPVRLATLLPFFVGTSGLFQAREKT